jgi:hypothetical protein
VEAPSELHVLRVTTIRRDVIVFCNTLRYNAISSEKIDAAYMPVVPQVTFARGRECRAVASISRRNSRRSGVRIT